MDRKVELEKIVKERRRFLGLTQRRLAERIHVSSSTISRIETGRGSPSSYVLNKLASELGFSSEELYRFSPLNEGNDFRIESSESEIRLGEYIRKRRRFLGLSQRRLGVRIRVSPSTISRIETGKSGASEELLRWLADGLELSLEESNKFLSMYVGNTPPPPFDSKSEQIEELAPELENGPLQVAVRALADSPSKVDLLNFKDYAEAIADFVKSEKTEKPLTIAIDAAWGEGKTTLMRMIQDQLVTYNDDKRGIRTLPTVWFNAWKYDNEESLWAALTIEILDQVRSHFNILERASLWVKLNLRRFNWDEFTKRILKSLANIFGLVLIGAIVFFIALSLLGTSSQDSIEKLKQYVRVVGILGLIATIYSSGKEARNLFAGPFDLNITEYIEQPDYKEKVGFLSQFEKDFKEVINCITHDGKWPLVVFIDDLDRCAPPKPAEIIEAINILLDADHCVFILGMDTQSVARSIEAKYKDLEKYNYEEKDVDELSLGQHFLEKIIQIHFRIPRSDEGTIKSFVESNLRQIVDRPSTDSSLQVVLEVGHLIEAELRDGKLIEEAIDEVEQLDPKISKDVLDEAKRAVYAKSFDDSEDVKVAIIQAMPYLEHNPRKIKRFINNFRLLSLITNRRRLLERGSINLNLLATGLVISTRWPEIINVITGNPSWLNNLRDTHRKWAMSDEGSKALLIDSINDPLARQFIGENDLISLLDKLPNGDIDALHYHLSFTQLTA